MTDETVMVKHPITGEMVPGRKCMHCEKSKPLFAFPKGNKTRCRDCKNKRQVGQVRAKYRATHSYDLPGAKR